MANFDSLKRRAAHTLYPEGTVICLDEPIEDPYSPKAAGDEFTVESIDCEGQLHGHWKSGGSIAIIPEIDKFHIVVKGAGAE